MLIYPMRRTFHLYDTYELNRCATIYNDFSDMNLHSTKKIFTAKRNMFLDIFTNHMPMFLIAVMF